MSGRYYYDMRTLLEKQERQIKCLECKVNSGGSSGWQTFALPMFETVDGQTAYTIAVPLGAELISVEIEANPLDIGTEATLSGTTLTIPAGYGDDQRVYVVYKAQA